MRLVFADQTRRNLTSVLSALFNNGQAVRFPYALPTYNY